jgi:hypothetical protein
LLEEWNILKEYSFFFFSLFAFWKNFLPGKTLMKIGDYQQENLAKFGYRAYVKVLKKESYYVLATMVVEI